MRLLLLAPIALWVLWLGWLLVGGSAEPVPGRAARFSWTEAGNASYHAASELWVLYLLFPAGVVGLVIFVLLPGRRGGGDRGAAAPR